MSLNDFRAAWPASRACVADFMNGVSLNAHDFIRALQIVDCAKRLLTPEELVEALATDTQNCSINEDKKARFGDGRGLLVDHCQLGTIGKTQAEGQGPIYWDKTSQMYCAHVIKGTRGKETAADAWLRDAEAECAKVCLAYLECHPEPYHKRQSSFVVYCAKYWPSHIKAAQNNEVLNKRVMDFLTTPAAVESWLQVYDDEDATLREVLVPRRYDWLPASRSPLYHAVFHSLPMYTTLLMQSTIEVRDKEEALYAGCLIGNSDAVKALLDNGTDPNAKYGPLESTLAAAAKGGNIDIFRMLTRSGAKIPSDTDDSHPLAVAAIHGNLDIMDQILQTQDWDAKQSVLGSCLDSLSARLDGDRREEALAVLLKHVERSQKFV